MNNNPRYTLKGLKSLYPGKYLHVFAAYKHDSKVWEFTVKSESDKPQEGYLSIEQIEKRFPNDSSVQMAIEQTGMTPVDYQKRHKRAWND